MRDQENWTWTDPETGKVYSLDHLGDYLTNFEILVGDKLYQLETRVSFSNHCYTRSMSEDDDDQRQIVDVQHKRGGTVDRRVFCEKRWEFSLRLKDIISDIHDKMCFQGNRGSLIYRQEDKPSQQSHEGWYLCLDLEYTPGKKPELTIWVRSVHHRRNRPHNIRSKPNRFKILAKRFLESKIL
jgi:hypothetical protein